jgi:hypothetical protein
MISEAAKKAEETLYDFDWNNGGRKPSRKEREEIIQSAIDAETDAALERAARMIDKARNEVFDLPISR